MTAEKDEDVIRAAANNLQECKDRSWCGGISVYDIINCDKLIVTQAAAKKVEEVYA